MKKIIIIILGAFMLFGCATKKNHEVLLLGQTDFDGMKISFYKDVVDLSINNSSISAYHLYFSTDESPIQYSSNPFLVSKDKMTKFYVDLYGNLEITDEDNNIILPLEEINYETDKTIYIYHLENAKAYYEKHKNASDYTILGCVSSTTGKSSSCSIEYTCSFEDIMHEVETWQKLDSYEPYADHKDFMKFLEITFNKNEIGGFLKIISFYRSELDNGDWLIKVEQGHSEYYLLNQKEMGSFNNILK